MATYAADFWPLFWTIIGGGAVLTVLLTLMVATFSPSSWSSRRRRPVLVRVAARGHDHEAPARLSKAA